MSAYGNLASDGLWCAQSRCCEGGLAGSSLHSFTGLLDLVSFFRLHANGRNFIGHGHTPTDLSKIDPAEKIGEEEAAKDAFAPFYVEEKEKLIWED